MIGPELQIDGQSGIGGVRQSRHRRIWLFVAAIAEGRGCLALFLIMVSYFWWAAIWDGHVMVYGDAAHHGMSLLAFLREGLLGERYLFWEGGIYGGHPLFAESQGGFLNPVNVVCALLFEPEYGVGVLFWLNGLIGGAGVYALARLLQISRWAAVFACMSSFYASIWLGFQYNTSVTGTMAWIPWLFAAVEFWLNKPSLRRACLMAVPAALANFGGYPHLVYGAAIYLGVYALCLPIRFDGRLLIRRHGWALVRHGAVALLLALGLAAVQLIPLTELTMNSHRQEGAALHFGGLVPWVGYLRGLLFFDRAIPHPLIAYANQGSILVCLFAGVALLLRPPARILAHCLAGVVLFNLGMEFASPLFRVVYENGLLPGLDKFRIMHPFFVLAVIGLSTTAADGLGALGSRKLGRVQLIAVGLLLTIVSAFLLVPELNPAVFIVPAVVLVAAVGMSVVRKERWIPVIAVLGVTLEAVFMRSQLFDFFDPSILEMPEATAEILEDSEIERYKAADYVVPLMATFKHPKDPIHGPGYRQVLESLSPFPSLRWGIPSIKGVLALELKRREMIENTMEEEIRGMLDVAPGKRIIDVLGVKYVSHGQVLGTEAFEQIGHYPDSEVRIYRNNAALPSIRTYSDAVAVESPQHALAAIRRGEGDRLLVEQPHVPGIACSGEAARLEIVQASSSRYIVHLSTECPVWLFIADAYYPGWSATVDGQQAVLAPAQVLGKAVAVPRGEHAVEVRFIPWSFYCGAAISVVTLMLLLALSRRRLDA